MGNASTKEERRPSPTFPRTHSGGRSGSTAQPSPGSSGGGGGHGHPYGPFSPDAALMHAERARYGGNRELAQLLGMPTHAGVMVDRDDPANLERRRETRAEREQKRLERERINRERERERSMREESVDGGYLVTQGVYTGIEDFSKSVVRQLMIERRLAPFWKGLNDHSESWAEHQLVAAARGLPIPAADEAPDPDAERRASQEDSTHEQLSEQTMKNLTVPIQARSVSTQSEASQISTSTPSPAAPISASPPPSSGLLRGRAKTLATLTTSARAMPAVDMQPREMHLPKDPNVNGQPVEAYLYKDASECPICFLYYPPYLNRTRCCDQPICSECFVQIKRPDPHPPEHPDPNDPQHANEQAQEQDGQLVSEPSQCPYCAQPEFGITYEPLPFRRGLTYVNQQGGAGLSSSAAMSSSSSLASSGQLSPTGASRRRAGSLAINAPQVISTDRVRPDWATKLASARAHQARRSAAATALHTAAYLMNGRNGGDSRGFPGFGRRVMMRRGTGESGSGGGGGGYPLPPHMVGFGLERHRSAGEGDDSQSDAAAETSPTIIGPPRHSSRRSRVDDLEEMMMMEAIRLSLASEEERRKKEEKDARKDAKKRAKEEKKADKAARKAGTGPYATGPGQSSGSLGTPSSASLSIDTGSGKGKAIARHDSPVDNEPETGQLSRSAPQDVRAQGHLERSRAEFKTGGVAGSMPYKPSHLRTLSNVSSDASSMADSGDVSPAVGIYPHSGNGESSQAEGGGDNGLESMFNFRSLAAMIGDGDDEDGERSPNERHQADRDRLDEKLSHEHDEGATLSVVGGGGGGGDEAAPRTSTSLDSAPGKMSMDSDLGAGSEDSDHAMGQSVATLTPENVRIAQAALRVGSEAESEGSSAKGAPQP